MAIDRNKDLSIETLRGIAIILVVMGHVIGSKSDGGMRVADDSFLRHVYFTFQYLRMPLFTVISGWVYALLPVAHGNVSYFTIKKIRRIILPLFFVGGSYYIIQSLVPGTNFSYPVTEIWRILVFPYTFYWYLQALFIVFLIIAVVDSQKLAERFSHWLIIFFISILLLFARDKFIPETFPNYFGFKGGIYLLPFFIIGVGIKRFNSFFSNKYLIWTLSVILFAALTIQQLVWYKIINLELSASSGLGLIIGVVGTIIFLRIHLKLDSMAWMGNFAYTIYLFHSFGTSGGRIFLHKLGIFNTSVVFMTSLALGLFLPILIEPLLNRFGITRLLFLGRSYTKKTSKKPFKS